MTGPKTELWLVRTMGVLITVVGASLLRAFGSPRVSPEAKWLAMGSSLALAAAELWYVGKGRISKVYLADAVVEIGLAAAWWVEGTEPFHHEHKTEGMPEARVHTASIAAHVPLPAYW